MSKEDYIKAQRMGKRDYQLRMMKGLPPTLEVLDDILPPKGSYSEVPLGLVQIPAVNGLYRITLIYRLHD